LPFGSARGRNRFATDSPQEGAGFEPPVPREKVRQRVPRERLKDEFEVRSTSPLEGDGFEPSVPRRKQAFCRARDELPPVAVILCVGNSDQAVRQSWINRQRYVE